MTEETCEVKLDVFEGPLDLLLYLIRKNELDIHDIAVDADGRVVFSNTLFNCLATTDPDYSFRPLWTPPMCAARSTCRR